MKVEVCIKWTEEEVKQIRDAALLESAVKILGAPPPDHTYSVEPLGWGGCQVEAIPSLALGGVTLKGDDPDISCAPPCDGRTGENCGVPTM